MDCHLVDFQIKVEMNIGQLTEIVLCELSVSDIIWLFCFPVYVFLHRIVQCVNITEYYIKRLHVIKAVILAKIQSFKTKKIYA